MIFFDDFCIHFESSLGWECATYVTTKELKKKFFKAKGENTKQTFDKRPSKVHFLAKYYHFSAGNVSFFEPLLGWECAYVCQNKIT